MSDTQPYQRGQPHVASYSSPIKGAGINAGSSSVPSPPPLRVQTRFDNPRQHTSEGGFTLSNLGRTIIARLAKSAKRGNLPFLVVFFTCLIFFFSALAGIGYKDPNLSPSSMNGGLSSEPKFMPGAPVYVPLDDSEVSRRKRSEEMRALEQTWQKKKRPQDGAWMQKGRDTKAIKRIPVKPESPLLQDKIELTPDYDKKDQAKAEKDEMYDLGGSKEEYKGEEKKEEEPVVEVEKTKEGISVDQSEQEEEELELVPAELRAQA